MIKKINRSLFAKVFLFTTILLIFMSFLVYGLLAWFMPHSYSIELNDALDRQTHNFIRELEQVSIEESGGLFDTFLLNSAVNYISLYTDNGQSIPLPTDQESTYDIQAMEAAVCEENVALQEASSYEEVPALLSNYYFSFHGSDERYLLTVYGDAARVEELRSSFVNLFPLLLFSIVITALAASVLYSHMITKPVRRISRISKEMSALNLEWQLEERRSDELGTLEKSLNFLSRKLSGTLSELQLANQKLEQDITLVRELEQARLDFFSAASHELKTPVTIIKGQLEGMLFKIGAYKDREKYLARALKVTGNLERMVDEILTLSRLETASADFQTEPFDYIPLIYGCISEVEDFIAEKELKLNLSLPSSALLSGNAFLIGKVFSNLIGNAVKYSPQGAEITVSATETPNQFTFSVQNTGTHIPDEDLPKIFDAFFRTDPSRNRSTGGSGLGLYIVQKILCHHKSKCRAENTLSGVCFSFDMEKDGYKG